MINGMTNSTEVKGRASRRRFSTAEKLRVLAAADACTASGEISALLRREGLYSSHLANWRQQQKSGQLSGSPKKRGPVPHIKDPRDAKIAMLERKLRRAELVCDVQKKVAALCGWELATLDDAPLDEPASK
jgi:transposase